MSTTPQCHPRNLILANMDRVDVLRTAFYRNENIHERQRQCPHPWTKEANVRQAPNSRKESKNYQLPFLLLFALLCQKADLVFKFFREAGKGMNKSRIYKAVSLNGNDGPCGEESKLGLQPLPHRLLSKSSCVSTLWWQLPGSPLKPKWDIPSKFQVSHCTKNSFHKWL